MEPIEIRCLHCSELIYEDNFSPPKGEEYKYDGLKLSHGHTNTIHEYHFFCWIKMMEWLSKKMKDESTFNEEEIVYCDNDTYLEEGSVHWKNTCCDRRKLWLDKKNSQ